MKIDVLLLAAGMGTRLRPITDGIPKCLVPINGKPLLDFWLDPLISHPDVDQIYLNTHYLSEQVDAHLNKRYPTAENLHCLYEKTLLGTAGTLASLADELEQTTLVVHADNLSLFSIVDFLKAHRQRPANCLMTMMLFHTDRPQSCGIIELDSQSIVRKMHEKVAKPPGNLANGAVYLLTPEVVQWVKKHQAFDISNDVIPAFYNQIYSWTNTIYHRDIGNPESYETAQKYVLENETLVQWHIEQAKIATLGPQAS